MSEEIVRFDMDMDGSMEPAEHGQWVRYEDAVLQKREWVGLTDEDLERAKLLCFEKETNEHGEEQEAVNLNQLMRAAEQICKEKNT